MKRYLLLEEYDVHTPGDEMWNALQLRWEPVEAMHIGDIVGESFPCRRLIDPEKVVITFKEKGK